MSSLLVDRQRLYLIGGFGIAAMERIEETDDSVRFNRSTVEWTYEVEPSDNGTTMRRIGSTGIFHPAPMSARARGMIVFIETEANFLDFTQNKFSLVGLHEATGEEVWRHEIEQAMNATMNIHQGDILVRYEVIEDGGFGFREDPRQNPPYDGRLLRITPGEDAPSLEVGIHTSGSNPDLVLSGDRLFLLEGDHVSSFSAQTLERSWTYPDETTSLLDRHGAAVVQNMMAGDGRFFFTLPDSSDQDDSVVLCLGPNGDLLWERKLIEESCNSILQLSLHPDVVVVAGICSNEEGNSQLAGLDPVTGVTLWQRPTSDQVNTHPAVISGETAYVVCTTNDLSEPALIHLYDVHTGDLQQEADGYWAGAGIISPFAAADGFFYGVTVGTLGSGDGRVVSYETEPASIAPEFDAEDLYPCGVPRDTSIPLPIRMVNMGPGFAPNVVLTVQSHGVPVTWEVPAELQYDLRGNTIRIHMGDMEEFDFAMADLRLVPEAEGDVILEAAVTMDVRNIDPDGGRALAQFEVTPSVPDDLDIYVEWVEVTQGIQNGDHSIGLIAGKPTLLRVYAKSNAPVHGVTAHMEISGDNGGTGWSRTTDETVLPLQDCLSLTPDDPDRSDINSSFNFIVPPRMIEGVPEGPYEVRITLDPANVLQESDRSNNVYTTELDYKELPPICLKTHRVRHLAMGDGETRGPRLLPRQHIERALTHLPTREILQFSTGNTLEKMGFFKWRPYELDPGGSQNTGRLMATLWMHQKTSRDPSVCKSRGAITIHVGLVAENNLSTAPGRQFNGRAYRPGKSQVVRVRPNEGSGINFPAGGTTLAHEIGHNFGRRHVNCGNPANTDSNYPYPPCQFGPIGVGSEGMRAVFYGVDLMDPQDPVVVAPRSPHADDTLSDLLSYANQTWTSDYTWAAIRTYMLQNQKIMHNRKDGNPSETGRLYKNWLTSARQVDGKTILFVATIEDGEPTEMEFLLPASETVVPEEKALGLVAKNFAARQNGDAYMIELLDDVGDVIDTVPVVPDPVDDADNSVWSIGALLPTSPDLESIRLKDDTGSLLAEVLRTPSAPQVTLNEPAADDVIDDTLIIDWDATDADGDELVAMVQYSDDDGASWVTLAADAPESPLVLDGELIPGAPGTARIRLIVSDGFNATEVISDAFTVTPREPMVAISRPADGESFAVGEPIFLRGDAYDPEDGPLLEQSLVWEVDGIGEAGFGSSLILGSLGPGTHTITLTATDSHGDSASDQVSITVENPKASRGQVTGVLLGVLQSVGATIFDLNQDGTVDSADVVHAEE